MRTRVRSLLSTLGAVTAVSFAVLLLCSALSGCAWFRSGPTDEEIAAAKARVEAADKEKRAASQVASDLDPLGHSIADNGLPDHGGAVVDQGHKLASVLNIPVEQLPPPQVSYEEWKQAKGAAAKLRAEKEAVEKELTEARKNLAVLETKAKESTDGWFAKFQNSAAIAGVLGTVVAIASALNVPGAGLANLAIKAVFRKPFQEIKTAHDDLKEEYGVAVSTVAASDVGREALAKLDAVIGNNPTAKAAILASIESLTGQKMDSLEDYFKTFAKGAAVDVGNHEDVADLLGTIRNERDTMCGVSKAFVDVLTGLQHSKN